MLKSIFHIGTFDIWSVLFAFAIKYSKQLEADSIRVDTKKENKIMNDLFIKMGFSYCGVVYAFDKFALEAYELKM